MTKNKIFGCIVSHAVWFVFFLGSKQIIQITSVQLLDYWIAQVREDFPQAEMHFFPGF